MGWGGGSAKCHLSWQRLQVVCNRAGTVLPGPESGILLLDTELRSGFSGMVKRIWKAVLDNPLSFLRRLSFSVLV